MGLPFRPEERDQVLLFPPSIDEYLPAEHPARFMLELTRQLHDQGKLDVFYADYREDGRGGQAYHPRLMLSVLLHAYSQGITSSRKIALACVENLGFRFLAANQLPNFRSLASFRKRHTGAFEPLFQEVLRLCDAAGLVDLTRVAVDGRRVPGNASLDTTFTMSSLEEKYRAVAKEILEEAERVDAEEDEELGDQGYGLPAGLRTKEERKARIKQALEELAKRDREKREQHEAKLEARRRFEEETGEKKRGPEPKLKDPKKTKKGNEPRANTTDPESRLMKTRKGFIQGYNAQATTDAKTGVIVACHVTQESNDVKQLEPALAAIQENLDRLPEQLVADAGYWSLDNSDLEEDYGVELFLATKKDSRQRTEKKRAKAPRGRIPKDASPRERMERRLLTKRGQEVYKTRGPTAETPFGHMTTKGLLRFLLRGLDAVHAEWNLWCTVLNLEKLRRYGRRVAV